MLRQQGAVEAEEQRRAATAAEHEAVLEKNGAVAAHEDLRRSLYASDMQLAEEAWESGDIPRMRSLLEGHRPRPGTPDLRGFEWHYLRGLGTTVDIARLAHDADFGQLSPDGTHYVYMGTLYPWDEPDAGSKIKLKLLDVAPGRPVRTIVPFPGESMGNVNVGLTFSPDGKRFLLTARVTDKSGRYDWRSKVFDWETGRDVCTLADLGGMTGRRGLRPRGPAVGDGDPPAGRHGGERPEDLGPRRRPATPRDPVAGPARSCTSGTPWSSAPTGPASRP